MNSSELRSDSDGGAKTNDEKCEKKWPFNAKGKTVGKLMTKITKHFLGREFIIDVDSLNIVNSIL